MKSFEGTRRVDVLTSRLTNVLILGKSAVEAPSDVKLSRVSLFRSPNRRQHRPGITECQHRNVKRPSKLINKQRQDVNNAVAYLAVTIFLPNKDNWNVCSGPISFRTNENSKNESDFVFCNSQLRPRVVPIDTFAKVRNNHFAEISHLVTVGYAKCCPDLPGNAFRISEQTKSHILPASFLL